MIIEFWGIPGSGKTYQAKISKDELIRKGQRVLDLSRHRGASILVKLLHIISDYCYFFVPRYYHLRKRLKALCNLNMKRPKYISCTVDYCVMRIIGCVLLQDLFSNRDIIAVNDEGLMQWVIFYSVQYNIPIDHIMSVIHKRNDNIQNIFINTNVEEAMCNIKVRNRHVCDIDELDDEILKRYLQDFYNNSLKLQSILNY